MYTKPKLIS